MPDPETGHAGGNTSPPALDALDRRLINRLQEGFPVVERPFAMVAEELGLDEQALIARIGALVEGGFLSRFGPMFRAENLGGAVTLAAMAVPAEEVGRVAAVLNGYAEVAHNYERDHRLNLWFVLAVMDPDRIEPLLAELEAVTGHPILHLPKREEFYVGLHLEV